MARRFTLVFASQRNGYARPIGGPLILISSLLISFAAVTIMWSVGVTYMAGAFGVGQKVHLEEQNAYLLATLEEMEQKSSSYAQQMKQLIDRDKALRLAVSMPSIPDDIRRVGVGGPANPYASKDPIGSPFATASNIEAEMRQLLRESRLQEASVQNIKSKAKREVQNWQRIPTMKPVRGYFTSSFGIRKDPFTGKRRMHQGVDLGARHDALVRAPADGLVVFAGKDRGYGEYVVIDHQNGFKTRYGHMSKILTKRDTKIKRGEPIGMVGSTGRATGEHLHYEVRLHGRALDPAFYFYPEQIVVD